MIPPGDYQHRTIETGHPTKAFDTKSVPTLRCQNEVSVDLNPKRVWRLVSRACFAIWLGCVLALGGVGIGRFISLIRQSLDPPDFATYYLASRMLEIAPSAIYDSAALNTLTSSDGPRLAFEYVYPPFLAGVMRPLARLPYHQAVAVWLMLETMCLMGGLVGLLTLTRCPGGRVGAAIALVLLLLFTPAQEAVLLGQVSPILLLLSVMGLLLLSQERPIQELVAGILLSVATFIKIFPAILLIYLLLRRRWFCILGGAFGGVVCILAGLLWGGDWVNTWTYFAEVLPARYTGSFIFVHLGNQSLTATFLRPMGDGPLPRALGMVAVLMVLIVTWLAPFVRHPQRLAHEFALISMLPLLVLSAVYSHLYVLILLPMAVLVQSWYNGARWLATPLLLSFLLLIVNSYSEWVGLRVAIWVPFGLVGTLMVWGVLLHQVMQRSDGCTLFRESRMSERRSTETLRGI